MRFQTVAAVLAEVIPLPRRINESLKAGRDLVQRAKGLK